MYVFICIVNDNHPMKNFNNQQQEQEKGCVLYLLVQIQQYAHVFVIAFDPTSKTLKIEWNCQIHIYCE
jgi:hypothetical protein